MSTVALEAFPNFKFGCDPELFVVDGDGKFVCADGLIPGTKDEPFKVELGAVQVDGMAAEFNTDPAESFEEFDRNVSTVLRQLKGMLPRGYDLVALPSVRFEQDVWDSAPYHAKVLGCTPDYNAWTGEANSPPEDKDNPTLRTASGHLHIGWTDDVDTTDATHIGHCQDLVKQLDLYLGGWSLQHDTDPTRRRLYGKAGACRYKPYGVEYRVLSNFWVTSKTTRRLVWNRMQTALYDMADRFFPDSAPVTHQNLLIQSINESSRQTLLEKAYRYPLLTGKR